MRWGHSWPHFLSIFLGNAITAPEANVIGSMQYDHSEEYQENGSHPVVCTSQLSSHPGYQSQCWQYPSHPGTLTYPKPGLGSCSSGAGLYQSILSGCTDFILELSEKDIQYPGPPMDGDWVECLPGASLLQANSSYSSKSPSSMKIKFHLHSQQQI